MAVNDLSYSVQTVIHWWQRRFLLRFICKFTDSSLVLSLINLFIGAINVTIHLIFYEVCTMDYIIFLGTHTIAFGLHIIWQLPSPTQLPAFTTTEIFLPFNSWIS